MTELSTKNPQELSMTFLLKTIKIQTTVPIHEYLASRYRMSEGGIYFVIEYEWHGGSEDASNIGSLIYIPYTSIHRIIFKGEDITDSKTDKKPAQQPLG